MWKTPCTSPRPTFKETGTSSISRPHNRDSDATLNLAQSRCRRYIHACPRCESASLARPCLRRDFGKRCQDGDESGACN